MRISKLFLFIVLLTAVFIRPNESIFCYELESGETLNYAAKFLHIIPLGNATIRVKEASYEDGKKVLPIICEARTARWIGLLFKAEAVLSAYVDMTKIHSYKFEQILKVAGKPDDIRRATYDRKNNIMEAEGKGQKKVPADVRDPITAIYYLRTQELKEGLEIKQIVNNNQSNYVFNAWVSGKKKIGRFNCWVLDAKIRRENKSMYHSMDAVIYISDDERRLPVMIKARTQVGPVTLRLKIR